VHELNENWGNIRQGVSVLIFVDWEANQRDSFMFQLAKHFSLADRRFDSSQLSADKYRSFNKKEMYLMFIGPCIILIVE